MRLLLQEIAELRLLQERHERFTSQTDDKGVHKAHMRVASALEQTVFEMENNLMTALKMVAIEGERKP